MLQNMRWGGGVKGETQEELDIEKREVVVRAICGGDIIDEVRWVTGGTGS